MVRDGIGPNLFSLGICKATDGSQSDVGNQADTNEWQTAAYLGTGPTSGYGTVTGVDAGCADPDLGTKAGGVADGYGCPDSSTDVTCYEVTASSAFCLETLSPNGGLAIIPIAAIDSSYAGDDITLQLFDAGDVSGSNLVNILGPNTNPNPNADAQGNKNFWPFAMDIAAPGISGYGAIGSGRTPNTWWANSASPYNCPADYNAADHPTFDGPICPQLSTLDLSPVTDTSDTQVKQAWDNKYGVTTGAYPANSGNGFGNGVWMDFHIHIPSGI